jgi:hypothetical protein
VSFLAPLFNKYARKFDKKQLICPFFTTGGFETKKEEIFRIFTDDRALYYSTEIYRCPNEVVSVTGIAVEEDYEDYVKGRVLLRETIEMTEKLKIDVRMLMK